MSENQKSALDIPGYSEMLDELSADPGIQALANDPAFLELNRKFNEAFENSLKRPGEEDWDYRDLPWFSRDMWELFKLFLLEGEYRIIAMTTKSDGDVHVQILLSQKCKDFMAKRMVEEFKI